MEFWKQSHVPLGVTTNDPAVVFVIKSLLNPVLAVLTLLVCLIIWKETLRGPYVLVAVLAFLGAADFLGVGQFNARKSWRDAFGALADIVLRWGILTIAVWTLLHVSGFADRFDSHVLMAWALLTPIAIWIGQIGAHYALLRPTDPLRKAVIVGVTDLGLRLENTLRTDHLLRTDVVGYFEDRSLDRIPADKAGQVLGNSAALADYVLGNDINVVYVTLPMNRGPRMTTMLDALRDSTVSIYFVPDLFVFNLIQARFDLINGIPLVAVCESPFYGVRGLVKRLIDIAVSGSAIMLLSPVLLLVALGVRLTSPGPIVFKQKRYGLDGKSITVYKFRSMTVTEDGERNYTQVARGDSRLTAFGAFMRRTSLDELPQLLNVLEGSMSIVGPRPHAVAVNEQYRRLIPGYMIRHKVKPGITGWAQVNGYRGGDDLGSMTKRIELDLEYLRHWSLWLDLLILFRTGIMFLTDKRAY
jgi:putative colanic acid biosynthesis UDP-glucose lipid carrier transferase